MTRVTIAVDLAKHVFEVAVSKRAAAVAERKRLLRGQFERFRVLQPRCRVVMEACAGAHYWARRLSAGGSTSGCCRPGTCGLTGGGTRRIERTVGIVGSGAVRGDTSGGREIGKPAGGAGAAPGPCAMDGDADGAH